MATPTQYVGAIKPTKTPYSELSICICQHVLGVSEVEVEEEADNGEDDPGTWEEGQHNSQSHVNCQNLLIHCHSIIWNTPCYYSINIVNRQIQFILNTMQILVMPSKRSSFVNIASYV